MWMDSVKMADLDAFKHLPYFKPLYTTIIKLQMQYLVEQLSENADEETLLLTTNPSSGTVSKLTSLHASGFLDQRSDIKAQFTKYCYERKVYKESTRKRKRPLDSSCVSKKYVTKKLDNGNTYIHPTACVVSENVMNSGGKLKPALDCKKMVENNTSFNGEDSSISNIEIVGVKSLAQNNTALDDRLSDTAKQKSVQLAHVIPVSKPAEYIDLSIVKKEQDSDIDLDDELQPTSCNKDNMEDLESDLRTKTDDELTCDNRIQVKEPTSSQTDKAEDLNDSVNIDNSQTIPDEKPYFVGMPKSNDDWAVQHSDMDSDSMNDSNEKTDVFRSQYVSLNRQSDNPGVTLLNNMTQISESIIPNQPPVHPSQADSLLLTNSDGRFECSFCFQSFTTVSSKRRHERKHTGDNPFACQLCNQKFYRKDDLNVHVYKHKGYKPYSCHICQSGYVKRKMLELHLATAHNIKVSNPLP